MDSWIVARVSDRVVEKGIMMTVSKLLELHKSLPANPLIADPLFWTGYVDKVGTGTEDIVNLCKDKGLKSPEYHQKEDFRVVIWRKAGNVTGNVPSSVPSNVPSRDQVSTKLNLRWGELEPLITALVEPRSSAELREVVGLQNHTRFKRAFLNPLIEVGVVEMTHPDSPNSPTQRYRLTEAGKGLLENK